MKRFLVPAIAAAAILVGVSAGNAAECVNGFLDLKSNPNIPCTSGGVGTSTLNPDFSAAPAGVVIDEGGPAVTGSIQPAPVSIEPGITDAGPASMTEEPTSREDCRPGGYWLMEEPGGSGSGSILMACPAS